MSTDETIQPDVSVEPVVDVAPQETQPEPETQAEAFSADPMTAREQKMAALGEKRKIEQEEGRKAAALINDPELTDEEYDEVNAQAAEPEAPEPAKETTTQGPGWNTDENGERFKTLMVNGQEKRFSEADYDRMVSKDLAGDEKLRLANEQARILADRERMLQQREQQLVQRAEQPPEQGASEDLQVLIAAHSELLLEGDLDAANAKMVEIIGAGRQSPTPNIDAIAAQAATRVEAHQQHQKHQQSISEGWEAFKADYSDIVADETALVVADSKLKKLRAERPELSPREVILLAGQQTREYLHMPATAPADTGEASAQNLRAQRQERKGNVRPLPSASGQRHQPPKQPTLDNSPAAKIGRMRAGRAG